MDRTDPLEIKPWMLPLIVIGLVAPITIVAILFGPVGAFMAGFLVTAIVAVIAVRMRYDEEIEVAPSPDSRHRALIVAMAPIERPEHGRMVADELESDANGFDDKAAALLLAPSQSGQLAEWLSDVDPARTEAGRLVETSIATLRRAGVEAEGRVGEGDVVQTIEDTLRTFPASDLIFVTDANPQKHVVDELRRRLDRPVHELQLRSG